MGEVPEITPKALAAHLLGYLNLEVDILPPLKDPVYALNQKRLQYDAGVILQTMESEPFQDYAKIIGVVDVDIFVPILTHVSHHPSCRCGDSSDYADGDKYSNGEEQGKIERPSCRHPSLLIDETNDERNTRKMTGTENDA